jgi:hypothetical protein
MNLGVVVSAEQAKVVDDGHPAVCPEDDVVGVTPSRRSCTATSHTASVTSHDGPPKSRRDHPGLSSYVENLRPGTEHDPADAGVAGELSDRLGIGDDSALGLVEPPTAPLQRRHVDMDIDVRTFATDDR